MKMRSLSAIFLLLAATFSTLAVADVVVNGTAVNTITLNGTVVTDLSFVQSGNTLSISTAAVVDPCADPNAASCAGSAAFCETNPTHKLCPGSTAYCAANPQNVSCPGSQAFCAVPGNESHPSCVEDVCQGGSTVFETLPWTDQPRKVTVITGKDGVSSKMLTTGSASYKGYFAAAADSSSGSLTRRMWFSECPGGAPIVHEYTSRGVTQNACDVNGSEPKLSWSQENNPTFVTQCKLERNKQYYLNYSQAAFGTGAGPTSTSKFYRSASASGTP